MQWSVDIGLSKTHTRRDDSPGLASSDSAQLLLPNACYYSYCQSPLLPAVSSCFFHSLTNTNDLSFAKTQPLRPSSCRDLLKRRFAASLMDYSTIKCPKTDHRAVFESSQSRCGPSLNISSDYDQYVWPWRGIILNASNLLGQKQGTKLENEINEQLNRFHTKGVHVLWDYQNFSGHAVVEFDGDWTGFADAMLFENAFSLVASDKWKWKEPKNHQAGLYGWVARADDYNDNGILGQYLRKNGVLKRISDMKSERKKKFVALTKEIDYKNWRFLDLESKYSCISREKDALNLAYAKERGKTLHLIKEIEKLKQELESQRMESEQSQEKGELHLACEGVFLFDLPEQGKTLHLIKENEKLKQELESQRQESEQLESEKKKDS
ncbi:hypothetical protein ACLOJK_012822 [Asimina triloba]